MFGKFLSFLVYWILRARYKVEVIGLDQLHLDPKKGVLFLPNHPAYVDPLLLMSILGQRFQPGILIDEDQLKRPLMRIVQSYLPLYPIPDIVKVRTKGGDAIAQTVNTLISELDKGKQLLLYPSGRIYRQDRELVHGTSSVHTILHGVKVPPQIVLIRTKGLWGSSLSFGATGRKPAMGLRELFSFFTMVLLNFLFFVPKRKVTIEFILDQKFPLEQSKQEINSYLEHFYNAVPEDRLIVPYYFFKRNLILQDLLKKKSISARPDGEVITSLTRKTIYAKLQEMSGHKNLKDEMSLAIDLDMDSLSKAELIQWIDTEFGVTDANTDQINTIEDALLYAQGDLPLEDEEDFSAEEGVHAKWYSQGNWREKIRYIHTDNVLASFVAQAKRNPRRKMIAEKGVGVKSYRDIVMGVYILSRFIRKLEGDKVGFMLPASTAAATAYLAILAAGKTPVMLNWTVGKRNLDHAIESLGIKKIITANQLIDKLKDQGIEFSGGEESFFPLENIRSQINMWMKVKALLVAFFRPAHLLRRKVSKTAAILFTSGSENLPKTVPISQKAVMANIEGVLQFVTIYSRDKFFGFLPPFHSFGLTVDLIMPMILGVPIVYHNNPTQPNIMGKLIEKYRPTVIIATPTFLSGILKRSKDVDLSSLRIAVVGAEKCPEDLFTLAQKLCHGIEIMEGYGITECSPVLGLNPYGKIKLGTVGKILPNIEYVLAQAEDPTQLSLDPFNTPSMLLVRGPSVFTGYLDDNIASPFVHVQGKEYYKTGDLVTTDADGYLSFSGRLKRFIKIGGEMVSLPAIENELLKHFSVENNEGVPLAIEARETEGRPEIVLFTTLEIDREHANELLKHAGFAGLSNIREVKRIESIPLLGTGKTNYRELKELL